MKICQIDVSKEDLKSKLRDTLKLDDTRLGLMTSIDGAQVITVILDLARGSCEVWNTPVEGVYPNVSAVVPQAHWFERRINDLFGILPVGHPRMKSTFTEKSFASNCFPLNVKDLVGQEHKRDFSFMVVEGEGVYEVPVGPVHAGIIEPGHFRLSCLGEYIQNLELRFGFVHRGIEKRLTEVHWSRTRFVAEAAASDTAVANALANAVAIESLNGYEVPASANSLRTIALEIERLAMHTADLAGMAIDLGFSSVAANLSRLRGTALAMAEVLSGSRFMRGFICPGGVTKHPGQQLKELSLILNSLRPELEELLHFFIDNTAVQERLIGTGIVSNNFAQDFDLVGVVARASGIAYDTRLSFKHGLYPKVARPIQVEESGCAMARTKVRIREISTSFDIIQSLIPSIQLEEPVKIELTSKLPPSAIGISVVEAFRGELIHLIATDSDGKICRYTIKDPSINNWTGMAIASRNELIADFPICNKSFGLSYSGHDL